MAPPLVIEEEDLDTVIKTLREALEEFDTVDPVVAGLDDDYFGTIVREFLAGGAGRQALVGAAPSVLLPAADIVAFAVRWLEQQAGPFSH